MTTANWFGGYYQDPKNFIMALADRADHLFRRLSQRIRGRTGPASGLHARPRQRRGRRKLAQKWGWKIGDRIPLNSNIFSQKNGGRTWDLTIAGIVTGKAEHVDTNFLLFQYAYFDETRSFGKDTIGWMILQTTSPENNDRVAKAIDAMFANSTAENLDRHRKGVRQGVRSAVRQHRADRVLVVGAAFVTILMIVGNTMALSIRERTREIGVLKTLGFSGPRILAMVLGESGAAGAARRNPGLAIAALIALALRSSLANIVPARGIADDRAAGAGADDRARADHRDHPGAQRHAA